MAKKIGVIIDFLNPTYEKMINEAAAKHGYEVTYFPSSAAAVKASSLRKIFSYTPSARVRKQSSR